LLTAVNVPFFTALLARLTRPCKVTTHSVAQNNKILPNFSLTLGSR